jgi:hypothetical protein
MIRPETSTVAIRRPPGDKSFGGVAQVMGGELVEELLKGA